MSMSTTIVYGYGFPADTVLDRNLRQFILNHAETIRSNHEEYAAELIEFAATDFGETVEDAFCDITCEESQQEGALAIVSNTMSEETGIGFEYQPGQEDCDSVPTILLTSALPWLYSEREKSLTMQEADQIMASYMSELGVPGEPGEISVEYCS